MLALAVLATLPHSNGALDGLLGSASMIYSKFACYVGERHTRP